MNLSCPMDTYLCPTPTYGSLRQVPQLIEHQPGFLLKASRDSGPLGSMRYKNNVRWQHLSRMKNVRLS